MHDSTHLKQVDSENALTAFLAAAVTVYPDVASGVYPLIQVSAVGLLALTLLKRVAIINEMTATAVSEIATFAVMVVPVT